MKATFQTKQLLNALSKVLPVIPARASRTILFNVLLRVTSGGQATISASNLENWLSVTIPCECDEAGEICMLGDRLNDILRVCRSQTIILESDDSGVLIRGVENHYKVRALTADPAEFPTNDKKVNGHHIDIDSGVLKESLRRTIFAAGGEHERYALSGVKFDPSDGHLFLAATEGHHIVVTASEITGETDAGIVPAAVVRLAEKLLPDEGPCQVEIDTSTIAIGGGSEANGNAFLLVGRLLEGTFPNWRNAFPETDETLFTVPASELLAVVQEAAVATDMESNGVRIEAANGKLSCSCQAADVGKSESEMDVAGWDGRAKTIVNHRMLTTFLRVLADEEAEFKQLCWSQALYVQAGMTRYALFPMTGGLDEETEEDEVETAAA